MSNKKHNTISSNTEWNLNRNFESNLGFLKWITLIEKKIIDRYGFNLIEIPEEDYMLYYKQKYSSVMIVQILAELLIFG